MFDALDSVKQAAQQRLEQAVGEGRLTLEEFTDRVGQVWQATEPATVQRALADLPAPVPPAQVTTGRFTVDRVFDDVSRDGRFALASGARLTSFFGDVRLDMRQVVLSERVVDLEVSSVFGDVRVIVPPGIAVDVDATTWLGDRDIQVVAGAPLPGSPQVRLTARTVFGDVRVSTRS